MGLERLGKHLHASINQTLTDLLGETNRALFIEHLEKRASIENHDVQKNIAEFSTALDEFGDVGRVLGRAIAKRLFSRVGLKYEEDTNRSLYDYVRVMQEKGIIDE